MAIVAFFAATLVRSYLINKQNLHLKFLIISTKSFILDDHFQNGANPHVCLAVIRQDSYDGLNALVEYYQMVSHSLKV